MQHGIWQMYDKTKEYYDEQMHLITYEEFVAKYPQTIAEKMVVEQLGNNIINVMPYLSARTVYRVPEEVTDIDESIEVMNENYRLDYTESTPLERIASSLEYIVLTLMKEE